MKKLLIIGCTHGDEQIGKYIFEKYPQGKNTYWEFKTLIGNPEAMMLSTRYTETDLNRSFDVPNPVSYEQKRAIALITEISKADLVVDIHQTTAIMDDCIFVVDSNPELIQVCSYFEIKHIVLAKGFGGKNKSTLIENCNGSIGGLAIEYARTGDYDQECEKVEKDITNLISKNTVFTNQNYYKLVGNLQQKPSKELQNWVQIPLDILEEIGSDGEIYPIFIGEQAYGEQYCILVERVLL